MTAYHSKNPPPPSPAHDARCLAELHAGLERREERVGHVLRVNNRWEAVAARLLGIGRVVLVERQNVTTLSRVRKL